ncbi:MAG: ABC transporter permease [Candidatus Heimdallarchaeota archaeon]|nr:ABC transporter permease [Candidatus Heimdallarchaeota archaeon]
MERFFARKKMDIYQWFTLFLFNTIIPWLIWDIIYLLYIPIPFLVIWVPWTISKVVKSRNTGYETTGSLEDYPPLILKYLKINKRYILSSMIGVMIAVAIFSSSHLTTESYKYEIFNDYDLENTPIINFQLFGLESMTEGQQMETTISQKVESLLEANNFDMVRKHISKSIHALVPGDYAVGEYYADQQEQSIVTSEVTSYLYTNEINSKYFSDMFSYNADDRILLLNRESTNFVHQLSNGSYFIPIATGSLKVVENVTAFDFSTYDHFNYTVDKVVYFPDDYNKRQELYDGSEFSNSVSWNDMLIFQSEDDTDDFISEFQEKRQNAMSNFYTGLSLRMCYYTDLTEQSISLTLSVNIGQIRWELYDWAWQTIDSVKFNEYYYRDPYSIDSPLDNVIGSQIAIVVSMQSIAMAGNVIMAILSLFLVYFSLTMVVKRKEQIISTMKIRGTEISQVKTMLLAEFVVTTLLAIIIGMILSIGWAKISLNTAGFLEFTQRNIQLIFPLSWFYKIPIIGFILGLDINYPLINSLASTSVDEGEIMEETKQPFWQRKNIDAIFFAISATYWLVVPFIPFSSPENYMIFWSGLGSFIFILLIVSTPLVVARYFSYLISYVSNFTWNHNNSIGALSLRNLYKYRFTSSKLIALIIIGTLLSVMAIVIPTTFESYSTQRQYYYAGSDMTIVDFNYANDSQVARLEALDIVASTAFLELTFEKTPFDYNWGDTEEYHFLGINPKEFTDVAYWDDEFDDQSIAELMGLLDESNENAVLGEESFAAAKNYVEGTDIEISFSSKVPNYEFHLAATIDLFPNLVKSKVTPSQYSPTGYNMYETYFVMNLLNLESYINATIPECTIYSTPGMYLKLDPSVNATKLREQIKIISPQSEIIIPESADRSVFEDSVQMVLFTVLHGLLLVFMIVSFVAFSYYAFLSLNIRKKEIGIFRAMGMVHRQIFRLYLIENVVILSTGLVFGVIAGFFYTNIVVLIFRAISGYGNNTIPPIHYFIDWSIFFSFFVIVIIINLIPLILPPRRLSKTQVGSILRME